jgi:glutaconate CoA-transferase subunit B
VADVRAATGWDLRCATDVHTTEPPTATELRILRELVATLHEEPAR